MSAIDIQQILLETGGYQTPPDAPRSVGDRLFGRFDAWYYLRTVASVLKASAQARRGRYTRRAFIASSHRMLRDVERCGGRLAVSGVNHLRGIDGPAVIVSNHMSMLETVLIPGLVVPVNELAIVVKESLLRYPFFGAVMRAVKPIAVTRRNPREDLKTVLTEGRQALGDGRWALVFPQATRSVRWAPAGFNSLGVKLARKASAAIVPLALKTDFLGVGRLVRDFGRVDRSKVVRFAFGEPIPPDDARAAHEAVVSFIGGRLQEWGAGATEQDNERTAAQ